MGTTPARLFRLWALGATAVLISAAGEPAEPAATKEPPVMMEAFKVDSNYVPKLSFGISLEVWKDNTSNRVISMYISEVKAGSVAEEKGLRPHTRVERINGQPVQEFSPSFLVGAELNTLFVNRRNGDRVTLDVYIPGTEGTTTVTLVERRGLGITLPSVLERGQN